MADAKGDDKKLYPMKFKSNVPGLYNAVFEVRDLSILYDFRSRPGVSSVTLTVEHKNETNEYDLVSGSNELKVVLLPGENKVTITAYNSADEALAENSFLVKGKGFVYPIIPVKLIEETEEEPVYNPRKILIDFHINEIVIEGEKDEKRYPQELIDKISLDIEQIAPMLEPPIELDVVWKSSNGKPRIVSGSRPRPIIRYVVHNNPNADAEMQPEIRGGAIIVSSGNFNYSEMATRTAFWHEAAHLYWQRGVEGYMPHFRNEAFEEIFNMLDVRGSPSVFAVFDESNYPGAGGGHPYDNADELFASASAVLKFFPKEFMEKVSRLRPNERKEAVQVANFVVRMYKQHPECPKDLFEPELLKFLGIEKKEAQPPRLKH
ncbi:MAG: hypothetical protein V1492_00485 [Candidatus Micrarchaeota archaeon]